MKVTDTNWYVAVKAKTPLLDFLRAYAQKAGVPNGNWSDAAGFDAIGFSPNSGFLTDWGIAATYSDGRAQEITVQQFLQLCDEYAAKPKKQVLDLDRNTRVTYKPGKNHVTIFSEEGAICLQLAEITQIATFIDTHKPTP